MRFGKTAGEAAEEPSRGGGDYIRYLRQGDNKMWIIDEPNKWTYYWEHFNPDGFAFPCTNERDTCPGCTSENEKMKRASRQVAFHAVNKTPTETYVNVHKVPGRVAEMLINRHDRKSPPTITDREYTITKFKTNADRVEYDIEGGDPGPIPHYDKDKYRDIEEMLFEAYQQSWDPRALQEKRERTTLTVVQSEDPPSEPEADAKAEGEIEVNEADLRRMQKPELMKFLLRNGVDLPTGAQDSSVDQIVDQLIK